MARRLDAQKGNRPDLLAGLIFIGLGGLGLYAGRDLRMGAAAAMGPGYLPTIVSCLILGIGIVVALIGFLSAAATLDRVKFRPLLIILVSVAAFAVAAEFLGFVIAAASLIGIGSLADREARLREVVLSIVVLTLFGILVFIVGLGVQMPLGPV